MDHTKSEFGNVCHGCLSQDRRIWPLAECTDIFCAIIKMNSAFSTNSIVLEAKMCFECRAILKRIKQFQEQVALAQKTLEHMYYVDAQIDMKTLSKLKICNPIGIQKQYEYISMEKTKEEPYIPTTHSMIIKLEKLTDLNIKRHSSQDIQRQSLQEVQLNSSQDIQSHLPKDTQRHSSRKRKRLSQDIQISSSQDIQSHLLKDTQRHSSRKRKRLSQDIQISSSKDIQRYSPQDIDNYSPVSSPTPASDSEWKDTDSLNKKEITENLVDNNQPQQKGKSCSKLRSEKLKHAVIKETNITLENVREHFTKVILNDEELQSLYNTNKIHLKVNTMNCDECSAKFSRKIELLRHRTVNHFKNGLYKCLVCLKTWPNLEALKKHVLSHSQYFKCNYCESHFCQIRIDHIKMYHTKMYICKKCGATLQSVKEYNKHCDMYHKMFICDYCNQNKRSRKQIIQHIARWHSTKLECKICHKVYKNFRALQSHRRIQHSKKVEENKELAYCVECNKQFANVRKLDNHLKYTIVHRKDKVEYPCPACGKVYRSKAYMKYHYRQIHDTINAANLYCELCDKYYPTESHLKQHIEYVHEKKPKIKNCVCDLCGRAFQTRRILRHHKRTHTGERPYKCNYCPSTFAQKIAMITHQKRHTQLKLTKELN